MPRNTVIARLSTAALVAFVLTSASPATADQAQKLYDDQEYEQAIKATDAVLARAGATRKGRVAALRIRAAALAVLGRDAEAAASYERLLDLAPAFQLPARSSPRVRAVFGAARGRWQVRREGALAMKLGGALTALKLSVQLPLEGRGGRSLRVRTMLTDPNGVAAEIALFYRRAGTNRFATVSVKARSGANALVIPAAVTASRRPYHLELFVQVVHSSGLTLRRYARESAPRRLMMRAGTVPKRPPITRRWWFWTAVATVVLSVPFVVDQIRDVGPQQVEGRLP